MNKANIASFFEQYCASFRPGNPHAVAQFYHCPVAFFPDGMRMTSSDPAEIEAILAGALTALEQQEFSHSVIDTINIHLFNDSVAMVGATFSRIKKNGEVLEQIAATYTLHAEPEQEWKIAAIITHATDRFMS